MKHFQFAIASIVDANTGYGLAGGGRGDFRAQESRSRKIRSKTVHAVFGAIGGMFRDAIADYRQRAAERRAVDALSNLNGHYLDDIGLTRGDIIAVKLGQTSLAELDASRRARLAVAPLEQLATDEIDAARRATRAENQAEFDAAKCA